MSWPGQPHSGYALGVLPDLASRSSSSSATTLLVVVVAVAILLGLASKMSSPPATPSWAKPKPTNSAQLRRDTNASFLRDRGFLFRPRVWFLGTGCPPAHISAEQHQAMASRQGVMPQKVAQSDLRSWWWFEDTFYWDSAGYSPQDVLALLRDRQRKEQQKLQRAHMMLNAEQNAVGNRRQPIPRELRRLVFERDGGQCVECGSNFDLQYDHVIPVALGGATSFENLQLLCGPCNREKSANI
jgi:hypothetical protein